MRRLIAVLTISALPIQAWAKSKIEEVVIFADRAKVTRLASTRCQGGSAAAIFEPLPASLDVRTLRGEGAMVIGVSSSMVSDREPVDERAKKLRAELEQLQDLINEKSSAQANASARQSRLNQYGEVFSSVLGEAVRNPNPKVPAWNKTFDTFRERRLSLVDETAQLGTELRALRRKVQRVGRQLAKLGLGTQPQWRRAEVSVKCKGSASVQVGLTYVVPGAEWRPEYDLDFATRRGKVGPGTAKLTVAAVVRQSTGEDWTRARLRLSTAKPKLGSEAPYPAPLWVSGQERKSDKVLVQGQERREQLEAGGAGGGQQAQGVELEDGGQAVILKMPHRVTVVSDGRPYWVPVDVIKAKAEAKLVTIPKLRPYVFHMVSLKNPAPYPLLEGRVHSFRSGSYVGDTQLRFKGVGEPMEVSLGIDEEVSVERKTLTHRDRGAGFLSSSKHMARAFRIKLKNQSRTTEKIGVRENVRVSKIEDVEVELIGKGTTRGYKKDKDRGFMTWKVDLARGGEKEIDLAYEIHLPEGWKVR
jgi:uncharacterized protein (TIGR02231 family)